MKTLLHNIIVVFVLCIFNTWVVSAKEVITCGITQFYSETWKFRAGEGVDSLWMSPCYDDSLWIDVASSKLLKEQNISLENGFGWYRKNIHFNDSLQNAIKKSGAVVLHLGRFGACEEVYINGKLVGKTGRFPHDYMGYFGHERNYLVLENDIKLTEENLIAIKFHQGWSDKGGFIDNNKLSVTSASTNEKIKIEISVQDSDYIFTDSESITIGVKLKNYNEWKVEGQLFLSVTTDDYRQVSNDLLTIDIAGYNKYDKDYVFNNPEPGFYRYSVVFKREGKTVCEEKFNVGYEPEKIQSPIDTKNDFKQFWDNSLSELNKVKPNYKLTHIPEASKLDYDMYLVEMYSFGNELIKGYYAKPKKGGKHPVIIEYMGYGSSPYFPNQSWDGFAYFVLSIRGQALNQPTNKYGKWITYGLDDKNKYYYRGAFLDVIRALDFVCTRPEIDSEKIAVRGGSQGGALSFVAAALDKRVKVAAPNIPFLSDYPDYFKICPWPKNDFDEYLEKNPEAQWSDVYELLTYFDIKNLAQWIECPLIMGIGVQDNVCPPHINFAAYNQVRSEKTWMAFPLFGHSVGKEFYEASIKLFRSKLGIDKP